MNSQIVRLTLAVLDDVNFDGLVGLLRESTALLFIAPKKIK
jgi:hypothetical protein